MVYNKTELVSGGITRDFVWWPITAFKASSWPSTTDQFRLSQSVRIEDDVELVPSSQLSGKNGLFVIKQLPVKSK